MMKNIMKYICLLAMMLVAVPMMGQDYLTVYFKDGSKEHHKLSLMEKSQASKLDKDNIAHDDYQTLNIYMKGGRLLQYSFEDFDSIGYTKVNEKELEKKVNAATEEIKSIRTASESIEDIKTRLDEIKAIPDVDDAYVSGTTLFVEIEGFSKIAYLCPPKVPQIDLTSGKKREKIRKVLKADGPAINNSHKVVIANAQSKDMGRLFIVDDYLNPLENSFRYLGFDVDYIDQVEIDFFLTKMYEYNTVLLDVHGFCDKNNIHWIVTNDEYLDLNQIGYKYNLDYDQISIASVIEERYNEKNEKDSVTVSYLAISENLIHDSNEHFRQGDNNIFFNVGCETLKGELARIRDFDNLPYTAGFGLSAALMQKGVNKYFGYTESNCYGQYAGTDLFNGLLEGKSVRTSYRSLDSIYLFEDFSRDSTLYNAVLLGVPLNSEESDQIFLVKTCTEQLDNNTINTEYTKNNSITLVGATCSIDSEHEGIDLLFSLSRNSNMTGKVDIPGTVNTSYFGDNGNIYFTARVDNLDPNTTYYYQAKTYDGYAYNCGEIYSFTTPSRDKLITSLTVTEPATTMTVGDSKAIDYHFEPLDATNKNMEWSSSAPDIVSVDQNGIVSAIKAGTCTITVKTTDGSNLSATCSITVQGSAPDTGTHEYVDLGLPSGLKWATCNVGANLPEEYGDYFAWGETSPKEDYSWETYKLCNGSYNTMTKYCTYSQYGTVDNKTTLELSDDAARANWGGSWRMPTTTEQQELLNNCYWEWTKSYNKSGVKGYIVYKVKNDSDKGKHPYYDNGYITPTPSASYSLSDTHIFLPAAGFRDDRSFEVGSYGHYWSSSLNTSYSHCAYDLYFRSGYVSWFDNGRDYGRSVRPVCP